MQWVCACVHVYVRGLHALDDLLGVDFRPCTHPQRADAPAFAHPLIITHVRAHMFNDTRCNTCVRACRWRTWCCALTATSCRCCTTCTTGVGFRPSARPQRASAAARLHPPIIANFHARKLNATRCNVCVRASTSTSGVYTLSRTSSGSVFASIQVCYRRTACGICVCTR